MISIRVATCCTCLVTMWIAGCSTGPATPVEPSMRIEDGASTCRVVGDAEATKLARPGYRDPWKFPAAYL